MVATFTYQAGGLMTATLPIKLPTTLPGGAYGVRLTATGNGVGASTVVQASLVSGQTVNVSGQMQAPVQNGLFNDLRVEIWQVIGSPSGQFAGAVISDTHQPISVTVTGGIQLTSLYGERVRDDATGADAATLYKSNVYGYRWVFFFTATPTVKYPFSAAAYIDDALVGTYFLDLYTGQQSITGFPILLNISDAYMQAIGQQPIIPGEHTLKVVYQLDGVTLATTYRQIVIANAPGTIGLTKVSSLLDTVTGQPVSTLSVGTDAAHQATPSQTQYDFHVQYHCNLAGPVRVTGKLADGTFVFDAVPPGVSSSPDGTVDAYFSLPADFPAGAINIIVTYIFIPLDQVIATENLDIAVISTPLARVQSAVDDVRSRYASWNPLVLGVHDVIFNGTQFTLSGGGTLETHNAGSAIYLVVQHSSSSGQWLDIYSQDGTQFLITLVLADYQALDTEEIDTLAFS